MIREQSRFTINPLYIVAVALCCLASVVTNVQSGLLIGLITVCTALLCINLVSFVEKIADKNLRAFLIAILAATIIVISQYVFEIIGTVLLLDNMESLKWVELAVITLSIVPTYFETRITTSYYYVNMFFSIIAFFVMLMLYSAIIELISTGTLAWYVIIKGYKGFDIANQLFFQLLVIVVLTVIANFIYQKVEDRKMMFNLQVERYKLHIKQVLKNNAKDKEANND